MKTVKYLACITRMLLNSHSIKGMTNCPGSEKILNTHCQFCHYYSGEEIEVGVENPIILEHEEVEWE